MMLTGDERANLKQWFLLAVALECVLLLLCTVTRRERFGGERTRADVTLMSCFGCGRFLLGRRAARNSENASFWLLLGKRMIISWIRNADISCSEWTHRTGSCD